MESGVVRDGEDLVPFLFQFLVLLAYDNSQLVSIPEVYSFFTLLPVYILLSPQVMQRCDGVMASGHSVDTFAIPALQPLVLNLFVRPGKEGSELETQREVVLSMLLRVVDHSRVMSLLTHVLDCFSRSSQHWHRVSLSSSSLQSRQVLHVSRSQARSLPLSSMLLLDSLSFWTLLSPWQLSTTCFLPWILQLSLGR